MTDPTSAVLSESLAPSPSKGRILCISPLFRPSLPPLDLATALLADDSLARPQELVHGLLHRSTKGVIAGSSKAGKTWMLLDLAASVANGAPFLRWPTTQGKVLFVNLELERAFFAERLRTVVASRNLRSIENLSVWSLRGHECAADSLLPRIGRDVATAGYALIIIDPIYKLMAGQAENSASSVGLLCRQLDRLVAQTGAAVVYAHHFTKGRQGGKKAMDRLSGSGVFARDADTIMTLTEHEAERCFVIETTLRNLASPEPFVVERLPGTMRLRDDLDPEAFAGSEGDSGMGTDELLLSLLPPEGLAAGAWQKSALATGVSRATFFRHKARLEASGRVLLQQPSNRFVLPSDPVSRAPGET